MGRNKALVEYGGVAMADLVIAAARSIGADPVIVYGGDEEELASLSAPVVPDAYPGEGPVGGVLGVLDHLADEATHVLVLACDLAELDGATLRSLIDEAAGDSHSRIWVAAADRLEPMCAVWSVDAIGDVRAAFADGERALHRVIGRQPHVAVTASETALTNINTPGDVPR